MKLKTDEKSENSQVYLLGSVVEDQFNGKWPRAHLCSPHCNTFRV